MNFINRHKKVLVLILIVAAIIGTILINKNKHSLNRLESLAPDAGSNLSSFFYSISSGISNYFSNLFSQSSTDDEIIKLKNKIKELEDQNLKLLNVVGQKDYLKKEYELIKNTKYDILKANICTKDQGNWFLRFNLNKGESDGVKEGDVVVQGSMIDNEQYIEGLAGKIVSVNSHSSRMISINDKKFKTAFKVLRTQEAGIAGGSYSGELEGYTFNTNADIMVGDKLVTSGLGGEFPDNIYIGEVSEVVNDRSNLKKVVKIIPAVDIKKQNELFIIKNSGDK